MLRFTIDIPPRTKKNSQRIITNRKTGKPMIVQSSEYLDYEKECGWFVRGQGELIDYPVNVKCVFYRDSRRRVDLTNLLAAVCDILVKYKVVQDDNCSIIVSHDGSRVLYDKEHPRTEITIERSEE